MQSIKIKLINGKSYSLSTQQEILIAKNYTLCEKTLYSLVVYPRYGTTVTNCQECFL